MGRETHVRKTPEGLRYRAWNTISDGYMQEEMTEEEFRFWDLEHRLRRAREEHQREFPLLIKLSKEPESNWSMSNGIVHVKKWKKERR